MSKYTCRCIAVSLLTKVRCDNCHVFTIMISRSDDILRKVCHTIQTNYFMKMHKRSKLLVKLTKDGAWMVFDWSTDQDQLFLMHYYINLVKGCSNYLLFLGLLESSNLTLFAILVHIWMQHLRNGKKYHLQMKAFFCHLLNQV